MIETRYAVFYQPDFVGVVQRLAKTSGLPAKAAYRVGKIAQTVLRSYTTCDSKRLEILNKHVTKSEIGEWVKDEAGELVFENKEAVQTEIAELLNTELKIEQLPLELEDLDAAKLSPADLLALEFMLKT